MRPSLADPLAYEQTNVSGTYALLEAARRNGVSRFNFGSSSSVYGINSRVPFSEAETIELRRLIELLEQALGKRALIDRRPPQPGDVPITFDDISKARRLLGYNPKTKIELGIERFIDWFTSSQSIHSIVDALCGKQVHGYAAEVEVSELKELLAG